MCVIPWTVRLAIPERRHPGAEAGVRAVPPQKPPQLPPDGEEGSNGPERASGRVERGRDPDQPREVFRAARRRQRPYVFDPEVPGELVDPPRPGRLGASGGSPRCPRALPY